MSKSKLLSEIVWVEKYRPRKFKDIILPSRLRNVFEDMSLDGHLLFSGTSGLGKTTLARILANGRSTLFIDGSTETSIDVVRNKIVDFSSTASLMHTGKKVIIIDEGERLSIAGQKAMKATIEKYERNVIFIFTSNNPEKLDDKLRSRLNEIKFNFSDEEDLEIKKQYLNRLKFIAQKEGGWILSRDVILYLFKTVYPDLRAMINKVYMATKGLKEGVTLTLDDLGHTNSSKETELYETIIKEHKPENLYKFIKSNFQGRESDALSSLGNEFLEYLNKHETHFNKTMTASIIVHRYTYEATTGSIDPLIPLLACASSLSKIF